MSFTLSAMIRSIHKPRLFALELSGTAPMPTHVHADADGDGDANHDGRLALDEAGPCFAAHRAQ